MRTRKFPTAATAEEVILKVFRVQMSTPRHTLAEESWLTRRQDRYVDKPNRRQQLLGSEDSLGRQQGAEDAEWPSLARVEGTRQPWLATSLEEGKLQTETRSRQGLHQTCLREGKPKEKTGSRHPLMSPATDGGEQWPMRRVLPAKPTVHAPTTLWPCNYLWNGGVLSFWIVAGEGERRAPSLKGAQPQLPTATLTPLV